MRTIDTNPEVFFTKMTYLFHGACATLLKAVLTGASPE
jgi:hypothetical protein